MALPTVIRGILEQWSFDISSLVGTTNDPAGNTVTNPVRAPITASVPLTGSIAKSTAGAGAPDQTLKQFSSSGGVSINTGATVTLYTPTTGKTFYITDLVIMGNAGTPTQWLVQIKSGTTVVFEGYVKTDTAPIDTPGLETQPQCPGGAAVTVVFGTGASTTATYYIAGFEQ